MGNLPLSTGVFWTNSSTSEQVSTRKLASRSISSGITYYYSSMPEAGYQTACPPRPPETLYPSLTPSSLPVSDSSSSSSSLLSDSPRPSQTQSDCVSRSRPLLLFFSWLGARPGAAAKYWDLYLDRGMDVLLVQSSVLHFLWPQWGLDYGLKVLKLLEEPQFAGRPVLVHASSIGGYTFTQVLIHIAQGRKEQAGLAQRVIGHVYDSLVVGSLEHMAIGLGKTLVPRLEGLVRNAAMFYFWLFKRHTADLYENGLHVFHHSPITTPALFFFSENDAMCNAVDLEKLMDSWRKRGVAVESRKWKESIHAAHMRCHPKEYRSTLQHYLNSLPISSLKAQDSTF